MKTHSASRNLFRLAGLATVLSLVPVAGYAQQPTPSSQDSGPDPALANMAPADVAQQQSPQSQPTYTIPPPQQAPAPIVRSAPSAQPNPGQPGDDSYNAPPSADPSADSNGSPQADAQVAAGEQALTDADADTSADQPPPPLPQYDQPEAPGDDYLWTPGYWGFADAGYYWVPGVWVVPPYYGGLWTPGYWGWWHNRYRWHPGYWGLHVGFYGGINYGYGYIGTGYFGGYWRGNAFVYNTAVTRVGAGVSVINVYNRTVVYNHQTFGPQPTVRTSYNGGSGGLNVAPRPAELAAMRETHTAPLAGQMALRTSARQNPQAAFSVNHGQPAVAAQQRPLGVNRTIAPTSAAFSQRSNQPQSGSLQQPRQQMQQPRSESRPAPQPHASAPARSAPAPHESSNTTKH